MPDTAYSKVLLPLEQLEEPLLQVASVLGQQFRVVADALNSKGLQANVDSIKIEVCRDDSFDLTRHALVVSVEGVERG